MPKVSKSKMGAFLAEIKQDGVKTVYADPKNIAGSKMDALWTTKEAKYVIIKNNATKYKNKKIGKEFQVRSNEDIEDILQQAKKGLDFVIHRGKRLEDNTTREHYCKAAQTAYAHICYRKESCRG